MDWRHKRHPRSEVKECHSLGSALQVHALKGVACVRAPHIHEPTSDLLLPLNEGALQFVMSCWTFLLYIYNFYIQICWDSQCKFHIWKRHEKETGISTEWQPGWVTWANGIQFKWCQWHGRHENTRCPICPCQGFEWHDIGLSQQAWSVSGIFML